MWNFTINDIKIPWLLDYAAELVLLNSDGTSTTWTKENPIINKNVKERGDMMERNKVLDLYVERKREEIKEKFDKIIEEEYDNTPEIKEYNEITNEFEAKLEELVTRTNREDHEVFTRTGYTNSYKYDINPVFKYNIQQKYEKEFHDNMDKLDKFANEVQAILSISDDRDYQIEVLKNYEILDKKGKMID